MVISRRLEIISRHGNNLAAITQLLNAVVRHTASDSIILAFVGHYAIFCAFLQHRVALPPCQSSKCAIVGILFACSE
jgi:hypothetical protein